MGLNFASLTRCFLSVQDWTADDWLLSDCLTVHTQFNTKKDAQRENICTCRAVHARTHTHTHTHTHTGVTAEHGRCSKLKRVTALLLTSARKGRQKNTEKEERGGCTLPVPLFFQTGRDSKSCSTQIWMPRRPQVNNKFLFFLCSLHRSSRQMCAPWVGEQDLYIYFLVLFLRSDLHAKASPCECGCTV